MTPIYSDTYDANIPEELKKHIIPLLKDDIVQGFNNQLTFIDHGIFIFPQYKSGRYIINAYPEDIFNKVVSKLYTLLHDCGSDILMLFLEIVVEDGKQALKPFPITPMNEQHLFKNASEFVDSINILRQSEQHNMKPDSKIDRSTLRKREKILKRISNDKMPETQEEWERCILWIRNNCENLAVLLNARLSFVEKESSDLQKEIIVDKYYTSLRTYYKKNMFDILKDVSYRKSKNVMYIRAICEKYKEEIANNAIELLKKAKTPIDPYKVVLQIAQNYI